MRSDYQISAIKGSLGSSIRRPGAGYTNRQIFAITAYVANRIAFSTVNDAPRRKSGSGLSKDCS